MGEMQHVKVNTSGAERQSLLQKYKRAQTDTNANRQGLAAGGQYLATELGQTETNKVSLKGWPC